MNASSRLPVVREPRYVTTTPMRALTVAATRGAAIMAAGAIARLLAGEVIKRLVSSGSRLAVSRPAAPSVVDTSPTVVEEVFYFRRRVYRRGN
jgi:hypothetical protein